MTNIFTQLLRLLDVKHTKTVANKSFDEHPYKGTMYGLSSLLSRYKIANQGMEIEKQDLINLQPPFVAQASNDLVIVKHIDKDSVKYLWGGKLIENSIEEFNDIWSGVVLTAETSAESIEPDYKRSKIRQILYSVLSGMLFFCLGFIGWYGFNRLGAELNIGVALLLVFNIIGVYVCYLLFLKQLHINSRYADKLCSLFKKSDCNNVLESDAAKLFGMIGWSEVGLGYFISNTLILLFAPQLLPYVVLVNIAALPYSFWSVWYQAIKVKQWCPLCLVVQAIFWCLFVTNLVFGFIQLPTWMWSDIFLVGSFYLTAFMTVTIANKIITNYKTNKAIKDEFNSFRMKDNVFASLLQGTPRQDIDVNTSTIRFGNPDAQMLITVFTNPHCNPCSYVHSKIEDLLKTESSNVCVQYIFSSFNSELEQSVKCLIGIYQNYDLDEAFQIYHQWYDGAKDHREQFYEKYGHCMSSEKVLAELAKHNDWKQKSQLRATPIVFVNGYVIPGCYKIDELAYFTGIDEQ